MDRVFNKELDESDKKEVLLKNLKNIKNKNEEQTKMIENKQNQLVIKSLIDIFGIKPSQEVKYILIKLNNLEKDINYKNFMF